MYSAVIYADIVISCSPCQGVVKAGCDNLVGGIWCAVSKVCYETLN